MYRTKNTHYELNLYSYGYCMDCGGGPGVGVWGGGGDPIDDGDRGWDLGWISVSCIETCVPCDVIPAAIPVT